MKNFKVLTSLSFALSAAMVLASCGGAAPLPNTINPYNQNTVVPPPGSGTNTGGYTTPVTGGTKTYIPVLTYPQTVSGTRTLPITAQVNAGDQIVVNVYGGYMMSYGSCFWGGASQSMLSSFTVQLNGQTLGSSAYASYTVPQAGTLSFILPQMVQMCGSGKTTYQVSFGQGVYIGRCKTTNGDPMTCPY